MSRTALALASAASFLAALAACGGERPPLAIPPPASMELAPPAAPARLRRDVSLADVGLDGAALDRSVDPCADFYGFACGSWIKSTQIPPDRASYVRSFTSITDRNEAALHDILEKASHERSSDPVTQKIGAYYGACMDEAAVEKLGVKPVKPLLDLAKAVRDEKSLERAVVELHKRRIFALFSIEDQQDAKDATKVIAQLDQSGLGLPNKEYYTRADDKALRDKYVAHVERVLALGGYSKAAAKAGAADVMRIETALADASKTPRERRDPKAMYNRVERVGVEKLAPTFGWAAYLAGVGAKDLTTITVTSPRFFEGLEALLKNEKPAALGNYLAWHVLRSTSPLLSKAFVDEDFAMQQAFTGQKELRTRWKRCVSSTDAALGELLAQPFLKDHFSANEKASVESYVAAISTAFRAEVDKLAWMDDATKARSKEKLAAMEYLIGYPAKWRDYDFEVKPGAFAEDALAARAFENRFNLAKIGKPVDRGEWLMTPPTVNAYYLKERNHMVFPAGILQPPFYSPKANVPVNLGAMGMVVGHELTHGFDDKGSQFDGKGNMTDWWSPSVGAQFKGKTQCMQDEYASFEPLPGLHLDGKLTLGENIADNGGLKLAFAAYHAMQKGKTEELVADGFDEDQQFFLGAAQIWCTVQHDDALKLQVKTNTHSPSRYRVNGPAGNLPEFADAFRCKADAPMRRKDACDVW
ncbi:MAG TPA: M13 family metallopeptidase [Byssovorax sp.]|jgi:predicted metalloendopeptidase